MLPLPLLLCGTYMICCNGILLSLISYLPWLCVVLAEAFKGIAKRALTANKWSRRAIKLETCSSRRTFSVCSWCKQDNKDATETSKYHQLILKTIFFHLCMTKAANLLSKCWACSIKNCEPCSHCRSNNCSKLWGMAKLPLAPLPNIEAKGLAPAVTDGVGGTRELVELLRCGWKIK